MATSTGIRAAGRETGCYVVVTTLADDGDETQTGFGFSVGRTPGELDIAKAARRRRRPGHPHARRHQADQPKRVTVVFDPYVTAQFLAVSVGHARTASRC